MEQKKKIPRFNFRGGEFKILKFHVEFREFNGGK